MTAGDHVGEEPDSASRFLALVDDISPRAVAACLMTPDREKFLAEYDRLVVEARASLDIAPIDNLVERWRALAALQIDPRRYLDHLRRAAELMSGAPVPEGETIEQLRARIGP